MEEKPVPEISAEELRQQIEAGSNPLLIDVRQPNLYDRSPTHISGDRRIPPAEFETDLPDLPKDRDVVIY